jgi:hypothetical protein
VYDVAPATPVKLTVAVVEDCEVATTLVGASSDVVIGLEGLEGDEESVPMNATTVNVYVVAGVSPATWIVVVLDVA